MLLATTVCYGKYLSQWHQAHFLRDQQRKTSAASMHFLKKFKIVGINEFLEANRETLSKLSEKTQRIVKDKLLKWRVDPTYLKPKKMNRPAYGGFYMWEARLTDKYRLRFAVSELQEIIVPADVDLLHDDRNNTIDNLLRRTVHSFTAKIKDSIDVRL